MKWLILLFPSLCFGADFHLVYHLPQGKIDNQVKIVVQASSFPEAILKGGDLCYDAFKDVEPIYMNPSCGVFLHSYSKLFENGLKFSVDFIDSHAAVRVEITGQPLSVNVIGDCLNNFLIILLGPEHAVDIDRAAKECSDLFHLRAEDDKLGLHGIVTSIGFNS